MGRLPGLCLGPPLPCLHLKLYWLPVTFTVNTTQPTRSHHRSVTGVIPPALPAHNQPSHNHCGWVTGTTLTASQVQSHCGLTGTGPGASHLHHTGHQFHYWVHCTTLGHNYNTGHCSPHCVTTGSCINTIIPRLQWLPTVIILPNVRLATPVNTTDCLTTTVTSL